VRQKDIDAITEVLANEVRFAQVRELPGLRMAAGALSKAFLKGNGVLDTTVLVALAESIALAESTTRKRLEGRMREYLRGEIRAGRISWGEIAELQGLADEIEPGDVELLEWAGVPEFIEDSHDFDSSDDLYCDLCELPERNRIHRTTE